MKRRLVLEYNIRKLEKAILEDMDSDLDNMSDDILKRMPNDDLDAELDKNAKDIVGVHYRTISVHYRTISDWIDSMVFNNEVEAEDRITGIKYAIMHLKGMLYDQTSARLKEGGLDFGLHRAAEIKNDIEELRNTNVLIANQKMVSALRKKIRELELELKDIKNKKSPESLTYEGKKDQEVLNDFLGDDYYDRYLSIKNKISDPEYKDIYKLIKKDPDEVKDFIDNVQSKSDVRRSDKQGAKLIYSDDTWNVYKITTYDAAKHYGKGTKWCISGGYDGHEERGEEFFNDYINDYDLDGGYYFYINKKDSEKKYCLLQNVNGRVRSIWDAGDRDLGSKNIMKLPAVPGINLEVSNSDEILLDGVLRGDATLVKKALSMGANVNVEDKYGDTALMNATRSDYSEIVKLLIVAGADVNAQNKYGLTALIRAVTNNHLEIVKLLLDAGADVNAKTKGGTTALKRALENGQNEIVKLLINNGAKSESRINHNRLNRKYLF
jgi:hypothetical protein